MVRAGVELPGLFTLAPFLGRRGRAPENRPRRLLGAVIHPPFPKPEDSIWRGVVRQAASEHPSDSLGIGILAPNARASARARSSPLAATMIRMPCRGLSGTCALRLREKVACARFASVVLGVSSLRHGDLQRPALGPRPAFSFAQASASKKYTPLSGIPTPVSKSQLRREA